MTKNFFITMLVAVFLGAVLGNFLFAKYKLEDQVVLKEVNSLYFITEGTYSSKDQASIATEDIDVKLIAKEDANYIVYLAITEDEDNLKRLEELFKEKGLETTTKKMSIDNEEFLATLEQMDLLIKKTETTEEIMAINEVILANYEEFVLN